MKPKIVKNDQENLFKNRLSIQLNPDDEIFKLAEIIPWQVLEEEFSDLFENKIAGRPAKPVRLIVGLLLLQHLHNLSDENVVRGWVQNPYWQYFCGYDFLQWELPLDPSSLTRWRKRLGAERIEKILKMTVSVALDTGMLAKKDLETVIVDTTVMPKNITHPTDLKLIEKARVKMVALAKKHDLDLRQNYNLVCKKLVRKIGGYLHAKQMKRAKRSLNRLKTLVGRVMRDCSRKIEGNEALKHLFAKILEQTNHLLTRKPKDKNKLYSLHEPEVVCIAKGKARKPYEFGCKVSLSIVHKKGAGIITSAQALVGNPYDGHSLKDAIKSSLKVAGVKVKKAFADLGYRKHGVEDCEVFLSKQKSGVTSAIKKQLKRRQAIEPTIGHLKNEGKLGLCRLKGFVGDQINALLCAASYNLKRIIAYLRLLFIKILGLIFLIDPKKLNSYHLGA